VHSKVIAARADGSFTIPGGLVARLASGSPSGSLAFPLVGFLDDSFQTPIVFLDNGPIPLTPDLHAGRSAAVIFPAGTLAAGQLVAYYVAQNPFEAAYLAAGGLQIAVDASGRLAVVGPDAVNAAAAGNPIVIAGVAGGVVKRFLADGNGFLLARQHNSAGVDVAGTVGAAAGSAAVQMGGSDGANLRALLLDTLGRLQSAGRAPLGLKFVPFAAVALAGGSAGSPIALWTPAGGKKFRLLGLSFALSAVATLVFQDAGTAIMDFLQPAAGQPVVLNFGLDGYLSAAANNAFAAQTGGAVTSITGFAYGVEE
jgi:hypothetical protein